MTVNLEIAFHITIDAVKMLYVVSGMEHWGESAMLYLQALRAGTRPFTTHARRCEDQR
jgi:hypothetical protein